MEFKWKNEKHKPQNLERDNKYIKLSTTWLASAYR